MTGLGERAGRRVLASLIDFGALRPRRRGRRCPSQCHSGRYAFCFPVCGRKQRSTLREGRASQSNAPRVARDTPTFCRPGSVGTGNGGGPTHALWRCRSFTPIPASPSRGGRSTSLRCLGRPTGCPRLRCATIPPRFLDLAQLHPSSSVRLLRNITPCRGRPRFLGLRDRLTYASPTTPSSSGLPPFPAH